MYYGTQKIYPSKSQRRRSSSLIRSFGLITALCLGLAVLLSLQA